MIYGLTVAQCTILAGVIAGLVLTVAGAIGMLWPRRTAGGDVLSVDFFSVRVKSNVMATGLLLGGIGLIGGGYWAGSKLVPQFSVNGRILLDNGTPTSGISVGLIPPKHFAVTSSNGTFKLELPRPAGDESGSYQAVVYFRDQNRLKAEIAAVAIDRNWVGTVDHQFGR